MSEPKEDELQLHINGEAYLLTRHNATLFTFMGKTMLGDLEVNSQEFDHVFLRQAPASDEPVIEGSYLFRQHPDFNDLARWMIQHDYPGVVNQNEVPECDQEAWQRSQFQDIANSDFIPEDWS